MTICVALASGVVGKAWLFWLVLLGFLGAGVVGMSVCRRRPLLALLMLPLVALAGMGQMTELSNLYGEAAMGAETGLRTVVLSYLAIAVSLALIVVGTVLGWKRRKLLSLQGPAR